MRQLKDLDPHLSINHPKKRVSRKQWFKRRTEMINRPPNDANFT